MTFCVYNTCNTFSIVWSGFFVSEIKKFSTPSFLYHFPDAGMYFMKIAAIILQNESA